MNKSERRRRTRRVMALVCALVLLLGLLSLMVAGLLGLKTEAPREEPQITTGEPMLG